MQWNKIILKNSRELLAISINAIIKTLIRGAN